MGALPRCGKADLDFQIWIFPFLLIYDVPGSIFSSRRTPNMKRRFNKKTVRAHFQTWVFASQRGGAARKNERRNSSRETALTFLFCSILCFVLGLNFSCVAFAAAFRRANTQKKIQKSKWKRMSMSTVRSRAPTSRYTTKR